MSIRNILSLLAAAGLLSSARGESLIDYHTDIAPLLRDYCAGCHNQLDEEGGFSVETFADIMRGGESEDRTILVPGDPDASYLLQTVLRTEEPAMPPEKEPQLSDDEVALLRRWIEEGAKGPDPEKDLSLLSTLTVPEMKAHANLPDPVTTIAFSPDGKWRAVGRFGKVELERISGNGEPRVLEVPDGKVNAVRFSKDGKWVVAASGITGLKGVALVFDVATGDLVRRFGEESHRDILFDAEFSPDGQFLATAGYDRVIRLWNTETGSYVRQFPSHNGAVYDLAFSPDGTVLASASGDSTAKIWEVSSGRRLDTLNQPQAEQFGIDFTPDGKFIVAVGADNRIRLWRFLSKTAPRLNPLVTARFGHEDAIVAMAISADGRSLYTTSADRALKRWTLPGLELVGVMPEQPDVVSAVAFDPSADSLLVARLDGSLESVGAEQEATRIAVAETSEKPGDAAASTSEAPEVEGELQLGGSVKGTIESGGETDHFRFEAKAGETWIFETKAARDKSALDSHLAILDDQGKPVERAVLQAVRDSWLTFRGKDSTTSGDFRVHNWREMELNEFLYINGEVIKLWHYPRGPDSGFLVYPGFGSRHTYFETTALSHPLGQPCYIVRAYEPGSNPNPNGLPVYRVYYENDDDATRALGKDSRVTFVAPEDGVYHVRVSDTRGFGGENFSYELIARKPAPDFSVSIGGKDPKISPGSGREVMFTAKRMDGFNGAITIRAEGLPSGLTFPDSVEIQPGQMRAFAALRADREFAGISEEEAARISLVAEAKVGGKVLRHELGGFGKLEAAEAAKVEVEIEPLGEHGVMGEDGVLEFEIAPGETIFAKVVSRRNGFDGRIDFGKEDSGRNFPHGVYVDNIGLNGLMIPAGKNEQQFAISAAKWVGDVTRDFHVRATADGNQTSQTVRIRVRGREGLADTGE